jgi:hypothetical protein
VTRELLAPDSRTATRVLTHVAAIAGVACALAPLPPVLDTPVAGVIGDMGHIPLFFVVHRSVFELVGRRTRHPEVAATLLGLAIGVGSEWIQGLTGRDPDVYDVLRDALGISASAIGLLAHRSRAARAALVLLTTCVIAWAGWQVADEIAVSGQFDRMMPLLAGFEGDWELRRWHAKEGTSIRESTAYHADGARSLRIDAFGGPYPGVAVEQFEPDWCACRWLEWTVFLPDDRPLELTVRVDEIGTSRGCTSAVLVERSGQVCRLDLVRRVAKACGIDLRRIGECHFFLDEPRTPRTLYLDRVRLVAE